MLSTVNDLNLGVLTGQTQLDQKALSSDHNVDQEVFIHIHTISQTLLGYLDGEMMEERWGREQGELADHV
jgi:hypothetical protein